MVSTPKNLALDRIPSFLAIVVLACVLSACAGGGSGGSSSATPPGGGSSGGGGPPGGGTSGAPPTVTVDNTQFSATVAPTDTAPNYQVSFSITDPFNHRPVGCCDLRRLQLRKDGHPSRQRQLA